MNLFPHAWTIVIFTALAGIAWILFARSQSGRWHGRVLLWLCLPFFWLTLIYGWFALFDVPIEVRMIQSRWGMLTISATQAIVLLILAWLERRRI